MTQGPPTGVTTATFQAGHASSILVTRSTVKSLVNALSLRPSYPSTGQRHATLTWWSGPMAFTPEAAWHSGRKLTSYSISASVSQRNLWVPESVRRAGRVEADDDHHRPGSDEPTLQRLGLLHPRLRKPGQYTIYVGNSADHIPHTAKLTGE
jgi:hypothetical protein